MVAFRRFPLFKRDEFCEIFADVINETRESHPFKLVGYVMTPDHVHLILNPLNCDISSTGKTLKGRSARRIVDALKTDNDTYALSRISLPKTQKREHRYAVWQKKIVAVDLWNPKFIRQKLNYLHNNPVRARLCEHPVEWKWSSYRAYLPGRESEVPVNINMNAYWTDIDFEQFEYKNNLDRLEAAGPPVE